jgi:simple sugar transport system ATP-binding protein
MAESAAIIVVYQPTRGLDMAAAEAVLIRLTEAADASTTVVIISSNIEELLRISDRIVVMNGGRFTGEVAGDEMTIERIGTLMTQGQGVPSQAARGEHV